MWEIDLNSQIQTFLLSLIVGAGFCVVFDILNIFEEKLHLSKAAIFIADILLFVGFAIFDFCFFLATENGEIRAFVFIGEIIGFFLCKKILAIIYIPAILLLFKAIKWLIYRIYRLFIRPVLNFFRKSGKRFLKSVKKGLNLQKRLEKV